MLKSGEIFDINAAFELVSQAEPTDSSRRRYEAEYGALLLDDLGDARCLFAQYRADNASEVSLLLRGDYRVVSCQAGGWLLLPKSSVSRVYWIPVQPVARSYDKFLHVSSESACVLKELDMSDSILAARYEVPVSFFLELVIWDFSQNDTDLIDELSALALLEKQSYFVWGTHTKYSKPADVYLHLIHGVVYENRFSWPHRVKIPSENDAHAIYVVLNGLRISTNKRIYCMLMLHVLNSVASRQGSDGGYRHGEWTDDMESHYRLHCSAIHLFLDAFTLNPSPVIAAHLSRAVDYICKKSSQISGKTWFLHDELEQNSSSMEKAPFSWIPSKVLDKSVANMVVLNTHVDTLVAVDRFYDVSGDDKYMGTVSSARDAADMLLRLDSAKFLYWIIFLGINLTFIPYSKLRNIGLAGRIVKKISAQWLVPRLPLLKTKFPRIVMPGGYIDRELSLKVWAFDYHAVNVMDLLRYYQRYPEAQTWRIIINAIEFVYDNGLVEKWLESRGKEYAVGFWAESLYRMCLLCDEFVYRKRLGELMITLENNNIGIPASLLGGNLEAVGNNFQVPCLNPHKKGLRVANLCRKAMHEFIIINASDSGVDIDNMLDEHQGLALRRIDETGRPCEGLRIGATSWTIVRSVSSLQE